MEKTHWDVYHVCGSALQTHSLIPAATKSEIYFTNSIISELKHWTSPHQSRRGLRRPTAASVEAKVIQVFLVPVS